MNVAQTELASGFREPATDAAHAFRDVLECMARPGRIGDLPNVTPPAPASSAAGAVLLTLCDPETPLALLGAYDDIDLRQWIAFHIGAPIVAPEVAMFALGRWQDFGALSRFMQGSAEYPDRSATLIIEQDQILPQGAQLRGPGIKTTAQLNLPDTAPFVENAAQFPLGLDFIFTAGAQISALPRSTKVEAL